MTKMSSKNAKYNGGHLFRVFPVELELTSLDDTRLLPLLCDYELNRRRLRYAAFSSVIRAFFALSISGG
jgi:hypothetical protein